MDATLQMIRRAYELGCPKDQVINFATGKYVPLPWQWRFHALARLADESTGPDKIGVGGSRGPGKSHGVFAQVTLDDCQRIPKLKALFLRQTGTAAQESFEDLISRVLLGKVNYQYIGNTLHFPNGSRVLMGGFYREQDISKYVGIEYDLVAVEELNQLTQRKVDLLLGSMRTSKTNWRPRFYSSFNPGGIGHDLVKETFVDPYNERREGRIRYVPATYRDNPYLNEGYIDYLENLKGDLGKAWRDGSFDLFEGRAIKEWDYGKHVLDGIHNKIEFSLDICDKIICFDWGYRHKAVATWLALTPVNRFGFKRVYMYREIVRRETEPEEWAQIIKRFTDVEKVSFMVLPHDCFAHKQSKTTIATIFARDIKINIKRGDTLSKGARLNRKAMLHRYLANAPDGQPYMLVHPSCNDFITNIPKLQYDELNVEDVAKTEDMDDSYDASTLGLVSIGYAPQHSQILQQRVPSMQMYPTWNTNQYGNVVAPNFWQEMDKRRLTKPTDAEYL